jgi:outer membrane receptor for ferrienterochelin and colicins
MVTVQPGVEIKHDQTSGERIAGKPRITDYAFFVSADIHPAERLHIRPGARVIHNSIYNAPPVIPSVNLLYDMGNNWQVRASYARGFRAPVLRELYFFFHDANHDINGNPDLKAEQSNSFNTAVSWHTRAGNALRLTTTLSGFYNQFRDRIDIAVIPGTTTYSYVNISSAKNAGGTLLNTIRYKQLEAAAGFSYIGYYNNLKGTSGGDQSTFAYAPEANANVLYTFSKLKGTVGLFYKFTGKVPSFQLGTTGEVVRASTAAFSMADLTVTKTINRLLFVQAGVRNVFDVTSLNTTAIAGNGAHSSGGPVSQAYGRSYFLGLHFEWNKTKQ